MPRLTHNSSGRFESRFLTVSIQRSPAVLLQGMEVTPSPACMHLFTHARMGQSSATIPSAAAHGIAWHGAERRVPR